MVIIFLFSNVDIFVIFLKNSKIFLKNLKKLLKMES